MSSLIERLRTWLWWLEPRFEKRRALHYGYERNWHRSRKWRRRKALEQADLLAEFNRGVGSKTYPHRPKGDS